MAHLGAEIQDLLSGVAISQNRHQPPGAIACLIADGTYNPQNDTAEVRIGWEMIQYDGDGAVIPPEKTPTKGPFPIINAPGEQTGLIGGERCWLFPVAGGALIVLTSYNEAPAVPAGEKKYSQPSHPDNYLHLKNDGTSVHSAEKRAIVTAPRVCLGESDSSGNDGVVRLTDDQATTDAILKVVQQAFNQLCKTLQPGSGVPPPTVQSVTAQASKITFSA